MMRRAVLIPLCVFLFAAPAIAQLSSEAQVSLVTIYPGDAVHSLWGHSALRIYDPTLGLDTAYNYGTFEFGHPLIFVARFAYGQLDYSLSRQHYPALASRSWDVEGRAVIEQVLSLNQDQRNRLFRFLDNNALPENRTYRYDFLNDNCATRIRDVLESILGDTLAWGEPPAQERTFRQIIRPYAARRPFLDLAMNLGLGLPADHIAARRHLMFLPLELSGAFGAASVVVGGQSIPLATRTETVYGAPALPGANPLPLWPHLLGWIALAALVWVTVQDVRRGAAARKLLDGLLFALTGLTGLVIAFLWLVSVHNVTQPNLHILWAWPSHIIVAWTFLRGRRPAWRRSYLAATAVATLGFALAMPFLPQDIPAAILPLTLILGIRSATLTRGNAGDGRRRPRYRVRDLNPCYRRERPAS